MYDIIYIALPGIKSKHNQLSQSYSDHFKEQIKFYNRGHKRDWKIKGCLWNTMPPAATVWKSSFSTKVKVNVKRSLTLVSVERESLVE